MFVARKSRRKCSGTQVCAMVLIRRIAMRLRLDGGTEFLCSSDYSGYKRGLGLRVAGAGLCTLRNLED